MNFLDSGPYFGCRGSLLVPYFMKSWVPIGSLFLSMEVPISLGNSEIVQYTAVFTLLLYKYVFKARAILLRFTLLCICILPENRYFLLAFYRYFRENLDSVIFYPRWQPWICHLSVKICFRCCWRTPKKEARWGKKRLWRRKSRLRANALMLSTWYQDVDVPLIDSVKWLTVMCTPNSLWPLPLLEINISTHQKA